MRIYSYCSYDSYDRGTRVIRVIRVIGGYEEGEIELGEPGEAGGR